MALHRSTVLSVAIAAVGLSLVAVPFVAPPDVPADRVQYAVEADWGDQDNPNLAYEGLPDDARSVFDAARTNASAWVNVSADEAPALIRPPPDELGYWDVRYNGSYHLLEARHLTYEVDFELQRLPRLAALGVGFLLLVLAAYRAFVG